MFCEQLEDGTLRIGAYTKQERAVIDTIYELFQAAEAAAQVDVAAPRKDNQETTADCKE